MIRAYEIVDEDETTRTYEYQTVCSYWLYGALAVASIGYLSYVTWLTGAGIIGLIAWFAIIWFPALADARSIRSAIRTQAGEISGSRWSFRHPLRIRVPKRDDTA